jgi:Tfp pilus assembly protein PilO
MRISRREKIFLLGGIGIAVLILVIQMLIYPAVKRSKDLDRLILQKEKEIQALRLLKMELGSLKKAHAALLQQIPAEERTIEPLAKLDRLLERAGLRENVRGIKPSPAPGSRMEFWIEVVFEKVDLPHLTRFLYEIQSSARGIRIEKMDIKPRYTSPKYLDVTLQMVFYRG